MDMQTTRSGENLTTFLLGSCCVSVGQREKVLWVAGPKHKLWAPQRKCLREHFGSDVVIESYPNTSHDDVNNIIAYFREHSFTQVAISSRSAIGILLLEAGLPVWQSVVEGGGKRKRFIGFRELKKPEEGVFIPA